MKLLPIQLHLRDRFADWFVTSGINEFLFKKNLSSLYNRAIGRAIIKYYDGYSGHQADPATGKLGYGYIHYALIANLKPKRILCVGSRKGFIPAICALACKETENGRVDFVDAGYAGSDKKSWSGTGWWKRINPHSHFGFLGVQARISTYVMTTDSYAKKFPNRRYDYIYIDGDHSYKGTMRDWSLFWPRLNRGGLMVFHDVTVRHSRSLGSFGVWRLWKRLNRGRAITIRFPVHSGLGIVQKT